MALFHVIDDAFAILRSRGVYKQAKLYERKGRIYAQHGSGFIALTRSGTTAPNVSVDEIEGLTPAFDDMARMYKSRADIPKG